VHTTAVIVPFASDDDSRHQAWNHVRAHYETHHPRWPIFVGTCRGTWSKGAAVADALTRTRAERLVIADADSLVDPARLRTAVALLNRHPWVVPQTRVRRLSEAATACVYDGAPLDTDLTLTKREYEATPGGGIVAITRDAYDLAGGIDPAFEVWGGEDEAFAAALTTLVAKPSRLSGVLWHLWHPRSVTVWPEQNRALRRRYQNATRRPEFMRQLVDARRTH
jgi:N-terminal domain of galactosyltransferase